MFACFVSLALLLSDISSFFHLCIVTFSFSSSLYSLVHVSFFSFSFSFYSLVYFSFFIFFSFYSLVHFFHFHFSFYLLVHFFHFHFIYSSVHGYHSTVLYTNIGSFTRVAVGQSLGYQFPVLPRAPPLSMSVSWPVWVSLR